MKILHVISLYWPSTVYGGPTTVATNQVNSLGKLGNQVAVAYSNVSSIKPREYMNPFHSIKENVQLHCFRSKALFEWFPSIVSKDLVDWIKANINKFDIVHIHLAREWIPFQAARIAINHNVPLVVQTHGMLDRTDGLRGIADLYWTRRILQKAAAVLALQEYEKKILLEISPKTIVEILPNGIIPESDEQWNIQNNDEPLILFLGRLHPRKNVLAFIDMARCLTNMGVEARFRIVGPDGGDLKNAERLVRQYGLLKRVAFAGPVGRNNISQEYARASIYVLPSINEHFSMTVLEALHVGTPTIVTDTCHIGHILASNDAAVISKPDGMSLANAALSILRNRDFAQQLSRNAKNLVKREFNMADVAARLNNLYRGCLR